MTFDWSNIKKYFTGKVSLATLVVTPFVLGGLGLLGFQTYSLITGKSFKDINFEIGRLWESKKNAVKEELTEANVVYQIKPTPETVTIEEVLSPKIRSKFLPVIKGKPALIVEPEKQEINAPLFNKDFASLNAISDIDILSNIQNPLLIKYYSRLESEYLINPNIVPKLGNWYVGFSFSPTLNYRSFGYDAQYVTGVAVHGNYRYTYGLTEETRNISDKAISSFNVGIDIGRRITNRLNVYTGLYYSNYGEQLQVSAVDMLDPNYEESEFLNKTPMYEVYDEESSENSIPYTNKYSYIEIPLGISYDLFVLEKFKVALDGGLNLQKLDHVNALVYDFETDYYYWITEKEDIFRQYGVGVSTGATISQFVGERLEMFVNPQFKYNLNSTFKKPYPVNQNQYSTGLRIGIKRHLF
ncbi:MAG: PorT family protein [Bacteroidia bacterium]|nr:PorT family protein [Bacteroidia bacterium]NNJ55002.1 hypothetical protein [Bacteroidia bacterium]